MSLDKERREIADLEERLRMAKASLAYSERNCLHEWSEPVADHIHHEGYIVPGDPPGTMGVDWRGPVHVPSRTEYRWKRTCRKCGKVEHTSRTDAHTVHTPKF